MNLPHKNPSNPLHKGWVYLFLVILGILILVLCSFVQHVPAPTKGEYYYSTFLRYNFTFLAKAVFFIAGLIIGYFSKLNPWYSGLCLNLVFPVTSIIEATVYKGSHNLIPFEFAMQLWNALPAIIAVYIGRLIYNKVAKQKQSLA
jgi:hypothetical protein